MASMKYTVSNKTEKSEQSMKIPQYSLMFTAGAPLMSQKPEPTPETSGGSNGGGDS